MLLDWLSDLQQVNHCNTINRRKFGFITKSLAVLTSLCVDAVCARSLPAHRRVSLVFLSFPAPLIHFHAVWFVSSSLNHFLSIYLLWETQRNHYSWILQIYRELIEISFTRALYMYMYMRLPSTSLYSTSYWWCCCCYCFCCSWWYVCYACKTESYKHILHFVSDYVTMIVLSVLKFVQFPRARTLSILLLSFVVVVIVWIRLKA